MLVEPYWLKVGYDRDGKTGNWGTVYHRAEIAQKMEGGLSVGATGRTKHTKKPLAAGVSKMSSIPVFTK